MAVTLQRTSDALTTDDIRWFLRDTPEHNILLPDDVEFKNADITRAVRFTVAKYNAFLPQTSLSAASINEYVLLCGVCSMLLRSEGIRQNRNEYRAQDGNIAPANLDEKQAQYAQWADIMQQEFDTLARQIKMQNNMEQAYGGIGSGYKYLGWSRNY